LVAWYEVNSYNVGSSSKDYGVHPGKMKAANRLGIYDMSGNTTEYCFDWYAPRSTGTVTNPQGPLSGTNRIQRGGSWQGRESYQEVNQAFIFNSGYSRSIIIGFRVAQKE
jgi:formylglycine-generating enzyme required for sulfatase activity